MEGRRLEISCVAFLGIPPLCLSTHPSVVPATEAQKIYKRSWKTRIPTPNDSIHPKIRVPMASTVNMSTPLMKASRRNSVNDNAVLTTILDNLGSDLIFANHIVSNFCEPQPQQPQSVRMRKNQRPIHLPRHLCSLK